MPIIRDLENSLKMDQGASKKVSLFDISYSNGDKTIYLNLV